MDSETLIHIRPKTDFEKLVWERHMNKLLCEEKKKVELKLGELQSEFEELKYKSEQELKEIRNQFKNSSKAHLIFENEALKKKNNRNKQITDKHLTKIFKLNQLNNTYLLRIGKLEEELKLSNQTVY